MTTRPHLLLLWVLAWLPLFVAGSASALSGTVTLANELHFCDAVTHEYDAVDTTCGYPQEGAVGHEGPYDAVVHLCGRVVERGTEPGWSNVPRGTATIDDMLRSGQQLDRNNLTRAGRALQKHGDRSGSVFPKSTGNPAVRNAQGQQILEEILASSAQRNRANRFGGQDIFDTATGRGARFDGDGNFIGFLEP